MPQACVLCGAPLSGSVSAVDACSVCSGCDADLPRLPDTRCRHCAVPLTSGELCGACLKAPPYFSTVAAAFLYRYPVDALIQRFKYGGHLALAHPFAHWLAAVCGSEADVIVPMPLADARLRGRGFNQAHEIARRLSRITGVPLAGRACRKARDGVPQAALPWEARARNVRNAFVCEADFTGQRVAIVDDVMTTGATLDELARTLIAAGAAQVVGWVIARAVRRDGTDSAAEATAAF